MRVLEPSPLMEQAAGVLAPVVDQVVVIGAVAVQVALAGSGATVAATLDVDAALRSADVARVVGALEAAGMKRSELANERSFTWVAGDLKVQLLRPFDPLPRGAARGLPVSNIIPELDRHRTPVAFAPAPRTLRFWSASPAALVALKQDAFGRTGPTGEPVERDFADAALLIMRLDEQIAAELSDPSPMRERVRGAATRMAEEADCYARAGAQRPVRVAPAGRA